MDFSWELQQILSGEQHKGKTQYHPARSQGKQGEDTGKNPLTIYPIA